MRRKTTPLTIRLTASLLAGALVALSPGLGAYEAAAAVLRVPAAVSNPGMQGAASAGASNAGISAASVRSLSGAGSLALPGDALPQVDFAANVRTESVRTAEAARNLSAAPEARAAAPQDETPSSSDAAPSINTEAGAKHDAASPEAADAIGAGTERGRTVRRSFKNILGRLGWSSKKDEALPRVEAGASAAKSSLRPAAAESAKADGETKEEDGPPVPESDGEHLVFDIHEGYFKAGYVAASVWDAGTSIELPSKSKERAGFVRGLAYRIAELRKSEAAGKAFEARAKGATDAQIGAMLSRDLAGLPTDHPALKERLGDADYVQGYLTAIAWRPGKQLMMPAPTLGQRLKPGLRKTMQARDEHFMEGLYAALGTLDGDPAADLKERLKDAPKVGHRDFGTALGYQLVEVMTPRYDKAFDSAVPYLPGKIRIPRSLIGLVIGHSIFIIFGIYMHISAQPYLVYGLTGSKTMMGVIRNVHFGAYSASSFLPIGPSIDKTDFKTMFIWTSVVRAALMGAIPLLFFGGYMTFAVLIGIVALNPMFQSLMTNSDTAARDSFLGRDENVVREGNAFATKVSAVAGLVIPAAAAWVVSQLVVAFGDPAGYAAAYGGYALMLLISIPVFMLMIRDPRYHDPSIQEKPSKNPLNIFVPFWIVVRLPYLGAKALWGKLAKKFRRGAVEEVVTPERAKVLEAAKSREVPYEAGRRVRNFREKAARLFDRFEATQGLAVILRSDTLSLLVAITAVELFIADALMFVLIPNYIIDVIRPQAALASVPIIGSMLTTPVGIMGLMLTAAAVGRYLGSRWAGGPKGARRIKKWGHKWLYWGAALSGLSFWGMMIPTFFIAPVAAGAAPVMSIPLFVGSLLILMGTEFLMALLATPLGIAMSPVRRKQIPNDMVGKVSAAFTMVDVGLMAAGALAMGLLIDVVPIQTAVLVIAIAVTMTSILEFFAPGWLKKINPEGWEHGEVGKKKGKAG